MSLSLRLLLRPTQTRLLSTTPQCLAARSPQVARMVRGKPTTSTPKPVVSRDPATLIPAEFLLSAHNSKVLPFGAATAVNVLRDYLPYVTKLPDRKAIEVLCGKHAEVTAASLYTLSMILHKAGKTNPVSKTTGYHLLASLSAASYANATLRLHELLSKAERTSFVSRELPLLSARITALAKEGNPRALYKLGMMLERTPSATAANILATYQRAAGLNAEFERVAGAEGEPDALVRLGRLLLREGRRDEARKVLELGEEESAECCFYLAETMEDGSDRRRELLEVAAASGVVEAMFNLGIYWHLERKERDLGWAKEWYEVAKEGGMKVAGANLEELEKEMEAEKRAREGAGQ